MTVDFFITKADIRVSILSSTLIGHNDTINSIKIVWHWNVYKKAMSKIFSKADFLYYSRAVIMSFMLSKLFTLFLFSTKAGISPQTFWPILFLVCLLYHRPKSMWLAQHNPLQKINIAIHIHVFVLIFYM